MVCTIVSDEEAPINFAKHPHKYCGILRRQAWWFWGARKYLDDGMRVFQNTRRATPTPFLQNSCCNNYSIYSFAPAAFCSHASGREIFVGWYHGKKIDPAYIFQSLILKQWPKNTVVCCVPNANALSYCGSCFSLWHLWTSSYYAKCTHMFPQGSLSLVPVELINFPSSA